MTDALLIQSQTQPHVRIEPTTGEPGMTRAFQTGETIPFQIVIFDNDPESGTFKERIDPATSTKIKITDPTGAETVALTDMTQVGTGVYRHEFATSGEPAGEFVAEYQADDSGVVTVFRERVFVHP